MGRVLAFLYGIFCYVITLAMFAYSMGFLVNYFVPKSIDSGAPDGLARSLVINSMLIGLFALQHSVMARKGFKDLWTRVIPEPIERSTYVLLASLAIILLMWQWRPMPQVIWNIGSETGRVLILTLYLAGWAVLFYSSFLLDHFDFVGMRQVYLHLRRRERSEVPFRTPGLYRFLRHPIMLGALILFWATPTMTVGHMFFAALITVYVLVGIRFEERDLVRVYGRAYEEYRRRVPMLLPVGKRKG